MLPSSKLLPRGPPLLRTLGLGRRPRECCVRLAAPETRAAPSPAKADLSLSELIAFESRLPSSAPGDVQKAAAVPEEAVWRRDLGLELSAPIEAPSRSSAASALSASTPRTGPISGGVLVFEEADATRRALQSRLMADSEDGPSTSGRGAFTASSTPGNSSGSSGSSGSSSSTRSASAGGGGSTSGSSGSSGSAAASPDWASALFGALKAPPVWPAPQLQRSNAMSRKSPQLDFAEPQFGSFEFLSQAAGDLERELPPLQSVMELTSAAMPPQRAGETGPTRLAGAGRHMEDGRGTLADGTMYERQSGEERGENGLWKKWTVLRGASPDGQVKWEEAWWEVSDWTGKRELGARKSGNKPDGSAWREEWNERIAHDRDSLKMVIERDANKWAKDADGDEWEEKWGEFYMDGGAVRKYADKWAKAGSNVWHEKWGEDYPGDESCVKYTDKWAERVLEDGSTEQWGDKWTESFGAGKGTKHGEVWTADSLGARYNRWWNEEHYGDGRVRKYGNGTGGEAWDTTERMDTDYNPVPHFGFRDALALSPKLVTLPLLPRGAAGGSGDDDDFEGGMDSL